jgi:hypothetical protein
MKQLFSPWALDFHLMLPSMYGGVLKFKGLFGVCSLGLKYGIRSANN